MNDLNETLSSPVETELSGMEFNELQLSSYNPFDDEHETRSLPEGHDCEGLLNQFFDDVFEIFGNSRLEQQGEEIMWGFVNVFDRQAKQTTFKLDKNQRTQKDMMEQQDGSEMKSTALEQAQSDGYALEEALDVFEQMRDHAAQKFATCTKRDWMPLSGSRVNTRTMTASMINSRDYLRAKQENKSKTFIPQGRKIVIAGGADYNDHTKIWDELTRVYSKYPDMVLIHGGYQKGVDAIAAAWASKNKVTHIAFKPDFMKHKKAAPFRRNDLILEELPTGLIVFPGNGITENLCDKARTLKIPVIKFKDDGTRSVFGAT